MKSKGVAVALALFLGGLGIHHFYLNNSGRGVMYLVFSITFIPAILAVIDAIGIMMTPQDVFDRKHNYLFINNNNMKG